LRVEQQLGGEPAFGPHRDLAMRCHADCLNAARTTAGQPGARVRRDSPNTARRPSSVGSALDDLLGGQCVVKEGRPVGKTPSHWRSGRPNRMGKLNYSPKVSYVMCSGSGLRSLMYYLEAPCVRKPALHREIEIQNARFEGGQQPPMRAPKLVGKALTKPG